MLIVTRHARLHWHGRCHKPGFHGPEWKADAAITVAAEAGRMATASEVRAAAHWLYRCETYRTEFARWKALDPDQLVVSDVEGVMFVFALEGDVATVTTCIPLARSMAALVRKRRVKKKRRDMRREYLKRTNCKKG